MHTHLHSLKHGHIYKPLDLFLHHEEIEEIHKTITKCIFAYTNVISNYIQSYFRIHNILSRLGMNIRSDKLSVFHAKTKCGETTESEDKRDTRVLHYYIINSQ